MRSDKNVLKETLKSLTDVEKILIVDVETTGLKKDSEIIQFSVIGYARWSRCTETIHNILHMFPVFAHIVGISLEKEDVLSYAWVEQLN